MAGQSKLTAADGTELPGYLAQPPSGKSPGAVVLIQEWWGLNAHMRDVADRLAREGFTVFAVDLYGGQVARDAAEAERMMKAMDRPKAVRTCVQAAEALRQRGMKAGVMGFCMGGALALATAAEDANVAACVPFYGIPPDADVTKIRARVLGHYAKRDDHVSPERVDALEQKLQAAGVPAEIHRYDADHAFFNDTRPQVYSPENARTAWRRSVEFLHQQLG
jgi:carboxymethylenebutenolidase